MARKTRKKVEAEEEYYEEDGGSKVKLSIIAIIIFALGLISLISLFTSSGSFGLFLNKTLSLGFGLSKWLFPFLLMVLSIAIYKRKTFFSRSTNYIGLSLLFIFIPALLHFFYQNSSAKIKAVEGLGGGYLGFYLSLFLKNILGFWGGLVIVLVVLMVSAILLFNITLSQLIGSDSYLYKFFQKISGFFGSDSDSENEDEEEEYDEDDDDYEEGDDQDLEQGELFEDEVEEGEDVYDGPTFSRKKISLYGPGGDDNKAIEEKPQEKKPQMNWKTKKIKIDLPLDLLSGKVNKATSGDIDNNILVIQRTLENFGVSVDMGEVNVGPTVTQYTFKPSEGIKVSRITALNNDLSLSLAAHPIRIEAPIPGRALVGIEVPNKTKAIVGLREILEDKDFKLRSSNLTVALGKDVSGKNIVYDIAKMPHLLVAGATNSGKSVCLNALIVSLLYQNNPADLRFIMVDPKRVELPMYNGIPHLLTPVITEVNKTINALRWCLNEMDRRYEILNQAGKKNIQTYNQSSKEKMPYIIFVIDELADLMVAASRDIEGSIIRLTQMSRAVGIHLILATQRPSVDVITGLIKANTPARIAFSVASLVDSKTILDSSGAEKLLGKGDMLFTTAELSKPKRIQGAYVDDSEILAIVNYIKEKYGSADYLDGIVDRQKVSGIAGVGLDGGNSDDDELLEEAREIVVAAGKASTSFLQRRLRIGYSRAASILDALEEVGVVSPSNGSKPREILISKEEYENSVSGSGASGMPLHERKESKAPGDYFYKEDESPLVFDEGDEEEEEEGEEEVEEEEGDSPLLSPLGQESHDEEEDTEGEEEDEVEEEEEDIEGEEEDEVEEEEEADSEEEEEDEVEEEEEADSEEEEEDEAGEEEEEEEEEEVNEEDIDEDEVDEDEDEDLKKNKDVKKNSLDDFGKFFSR